MPGCLVYAGKGWSKGVLHSLEASRLAANCMPDPTTLHRSKVTRELDHMLAAIFAASEMSQIGPSATSATVSVAVTLDSRRRHVAT